MSFFFLGGEGKAPLKGHSLQAIQLRHLQGRQKGTSCLLRTGSGMTPGQESHTCASRARANKDASETLGSKHLYFIQGKEANDSSGGRRRAAPRQPPLSAAPGWAPAASSLGGHACAHAGERAPGPPAARATPMPLCMGALSGRSSLCRQTWQVEQLSAPPPAAPEELLLGTPVEACRAQWEGGVP